VLRRVLISGVQIYPSYFQAPSAAESLLPDGLVFKRELLPVVSLKKCMTRCKQFTWLHQQHSPHSACEAGEVQIKAVQPLQQPLQIAEATGQLDCLVRTTFKNLRSSVCGCQRCALHDFCRRIAKHLLWDKNLGVSCTSALKPLMHRWRWQSVR
jgi:hypothetical protein